MVQTLNPARKGIPFIQVEVSTNAQRVSRPHYDLQIWSHEDCAQPWRGERKVICLKQIPCTVCVCIYSQHTSAKLSLTIQMISKWPAMYWAAQERMEKHHICFKSVLRTHQTWNCSHHTRAHLSHIQMKRTMKNHNCKARNSFHKTLKYHLHAKKELNVRG